MSLKCLVKGVFGLVDLTDFWKKYSFMSLEEKIKTERMKKGLTQEELAEQIKTTAKTIQRIESGKVKPRAATLRALTEILGLNWDQEYQSHSEVHSNHASTTFHRLVLHLSGLLLLVLPTFLVWIWLKPKFPKLKKEALDLINFQINLLVVMIPCGIFAVFLLPIFLIVSLGIFAWLSVLINCIRIAMGENPVYVVAFNLFLKKLPQ